MKAFFQILFESLKLSFQQLWVNKLRSFLSLLGITIGIFCIISILTSVDALKNNINRSISSLGDNLLFIEKWPWTFSTKEYPWWKYWQRPEASFDDYKFLKERLRNAKDVVYSVDARDEEVNYKTRTVKQLDVMGVTHEYGSVFELNIQYGRYFTLQECYRGQNVAVIGAATAEEVFEEDKDIIGKEINVLDKKVEIIGIIKKEGEDLLGINFDKVVLMPYAFVTKSTNIVLEDATPDIVVKAKDKVNLTQLKVEIEGVMRSSRRLRPLSEDNFAINRLSIISLGFNDLLKALNMIGWIMGFFALLIGGFGIANIMFVSVSERTKIIGIKKAMGAHKNHILAEFLLESIILCILGGIIGLLLVYILATIATRTADFTFGLSMKNILIGISVSILIGIISGFLPASKASKMDPVEAIRSK